MKSFCTFALTLFATVSLSALSHADEFWLSSLDLAGVEQGWGSPHANQSVEGHEISIAGRKFAHGLGTHAVGRIKVVFDGQPERFSAWVGVDDETDGRGSVEFEVDANGTTVWKSGVMRAGDAAKQVNVDLEGVKSLVLKVGDAGDGMDYDHADWADAKFVMRSGKPKIYVRPPEPEYILTPPPSPKPRINGTRIFGVRPSHPFLFTIAATGDRPMTFAADNLPAGLQLNPETGRITGVLKKKGTYEVAFHAKNKLGEATRPFKIVCGSQIGLTPAMGWNSWNCFASSVTEAKIKAAADAMVKSGLIDHGWTYINIDDYWQVKPKSDDPTLHGPERAPDGDIIPNPRFPDMKALAEYVHSKGLKIGLYSSPGPWTCGGCVASFDHELLDAQQYARWGFDYLKYDWCSYRPQLETDRKLSSNFVAHIKIWPEAESQDVRQLMRPYVIMRAALNRVPRDIIYSLCQYGMGDVWKWGADVGGNSWRTTGDIRDNWASMSRIGFGQAGHEKYAGPGHFNDPDMLVVGKVGWGPQLHPTHLTPNEQYTHISLWCLLSAPLLIGCDMTQLDPFTLNLLSNDEVLDVDQDPLGRQAGRVAKHGNLEVWAKDLEDGSKAVGLFNRGDEPATVTVTWDDLGISGPQLVHDLWRQKDLGKFSQKFDASVARHGVVLVKISPAK